MPIQFSPWKSRSVEKGIMIHQFGKSEGHFHLMSHLHVNNLSLWDFNKTYVYYIHLYTTVSLYGVQTVHRPKPRFAPIGREMHSYLLWWDTVPVLQKPNSLPRARPCRVLKLAFPVWEVWGGQGSGPLCPSFTDSERDTSFFERPKCKHSEH